MAQARMQTSFGDRDHGPGSAGTQQPTMHSAALPTPLTVASSGDSSCGHGWASETGSVTGECQTTVREMSWFCSEEASMDIGEALLALKMQSTQIGIKRRLKTRWSLRQHKRHLGSLSSRSLPSWPWTPESVNGTASGGSSLHNSFSSGSLVEYIKALPVDLLRWYQESSHYCQQRSRPLQALKEALCSEFSYRSVMDCVAMRASATWERLLDSATLSLISVLASAYIPNQVSDQQRRHEVVFAAWTTTVLYCSERQVRGWEGLVGVIVGSTMLQLKLLEEVDLDIGRVIRKLRLSELFDPRRLLVSERRVANVVGWNLTWPGPHVLLFLFLDNFDRHVRIPTALKHLAGRVLDQLLQTGFIHRCLAERHERFPTLGPLIFGILYEFLADLLTNLATVTGCSLDRATLAEAMVRMLDEDMVRALFCSLNGDCESFFKGVGEGCCVVLGCEGQAVILQAVDEAFSRYHRA